MAGIQGKLLKARFKHLLGDLGGCIDELVELNATLFLGLEINAFAACSHDPLATL